VSRKALGSFLCVAALIMLVGCLGGSSKKKPTLQSIAITPSGTTTIALGNTQQFTATGTFSDGSKQDLTSSVTWASSSTAVATISTAGLATSVGQGSTNITATSGTLTSNTAVLTVGPPVLKSIAVTPSPASVQVGNTLQFKATGTLTDGSTQDLTSTATWVSSSTTVATITSTGLATGVAKGTTNITAASGGITSPASVLTVTAILVSIDVAPPSASIPLGNTQQFTATGHYNDGSTQDLTSSATWASSSTSVATISSTGLATSLAQGSTNITATSSAIVSNTAVLTVTAPVLKSIAVTPANKTLKPADTQQYTATGTFTDGSTQDLTSSVTWASSDITVATITTGGLATAVANGTTTISATDPATLIKGSTTLTVSSTTSGCPSGNEAVFTGQYAFLFQGYDGSGPVALAGTFDADGTGKIATLVGVEDVNNSAGVHTSVAINSASSSYSVGSDNRGCLTIDTSLGTSTYRFALGSVSAGVATRGRLIEFDSTGTLGSGEIALQDPTAFSNAKISGNYAFGASSTLSLSTTSRDRFGVVGAFTADGAGGITTGEVDFNLSGSVDGGTAGPILLNPGSYSVDAHGRATFTFNPAGGSAVDGIFYVVSAGEALAMSADAQSVNPLFAGSVLKQSGGPFSTSSLSGNSVFYSAGLCGGCGPGGTVAPNLAVGVVSVTTPGSFSLTEDVNKGGTLSTPTLSGTYAVDASGRVIVTATSPPPGGILAAVYLVSPNQGFVLSPSNSVESGFVESQTGSPFTNASLKATFFFGTTNQVEQNVSDNSGVATFNGAGAVTGTSDSASTGGLSPGQAFSDTYSVTNGTGTPGRGTIIGTGTNLIFYIVSPTKAVLMDASTNTNPALTIGEQ
jgi:hypothetical protein